MVFFNIYKQRRLHHQLVGLAKLLCSDHPCYYGILNQAISWLLPCPTEFFFLEVPLQFTSVGIVHKRGTFELRHLNLVVSMASVLLLWHIGLAFTTKQFIIVFHCDSFFFFLKNSDYIMALAQPCCARYSLINMLKCFCFINFWLNFSHHWHAACLCM